MVGAFGMTPNRLLDFGTSGGLYQSAFRALHRFPPAVFAEALLPRLPGLIRSNRDWAGEILFGASDEAAAAINERLARLDPPTRTAVMAFVETQEGETGWLQDCPGWIRPAG